MNFIFDIPINRASIDCIISNCHSDYFTHDSNGNICYSVPGRTTFAGFNFENHNIEVYMTNVIKFWINTCNFDGVRLDDSDITPLNFLEDIRNSLNYLDKEFIIISQSYDEYHHLNFCNLTYDGYLRQAILDISKGNKSKKDFEEELEAFKYSFPKNSLRMRWLEEKEQMRSYNFFGKDLIHCALSIFFTFDGVPFLMMGQEFNDQNYKNYESLFNECYLSWENFDHSLFNYYKRLIELRKKYSSLNQGELKFIYNDHSKVISYIREDTENKLLIISNLDENIVTITSLDNTPCNINLSAYSTKIYNCSTNEFIL